MSDRPTGDQPMSDQPTSGQPMDAGGETNLPGAQAMPEVRRSVILETCVRLVFHTVLVFSLYLLFAGHNQPGGGFVGGLTAGAAFVLRYVAGGRAELRAAVPVDPGVPLGIGVLLATGTGMVAWLLGGQFLQSGKLEGDLLLLGHLKLTSVLAFDAGVYLVVVGLALTLLRTLGAEAER